MLINTPWGFGLPNKGTVGIFAIGGSTATTNSYIYASNAVAVATSLTSTSNLGMAAGVAAYGIFALGNGTSVTNKYTYSNNAVIASTSLTANPSNSQTAVGNSSVAVFSLGGTPTNLYQYSNMSIASGSSLTTGLTYGGAVGIQQYGLIQVTGSTTNIYTYSNNTVASGTSFAKSYTSPSVAGNGLVGAFLNTNGLFVYTFANSTFSSAIVTSPTANEGTAAGTSSFGIFALGNMGSPSGSGTEVYRYSAQTLVAGSNLTATPNESAAAGDYYGYMG